METKKINTDKKASTKSGTKASFVKIVNACSILGYITAGLCFLLVILQILLAARVEINAVILEIGMICQYFGSVLALAVAIIGIVIGAQAVRKAADAKYFAATKARTIYLVLCIILLVAPFGGFGVIEQLYIALVSDIISLGLVLAIAIISTKYKKALLA